MGATKRIAVEIPVRIPVDLCRQYVKASVRDEALMQAYAKLRKSGSSSQVTESTKERIVIEEGAYDAITKVHSGFSSGWKITYTFEPLNAAETAVEVAVEYGRWLAFMALGTAKAQAENTLLERISALLAFERGLYTEAPSEAAPPEAPRQLGASPDVSAPGAEPKAEPEAALQRRREER